MGGVLRRAGLGFMLALGMNVPALAREISIGLVAPMSGPGAVYGQQAVIGAQAYVDGVNKQGGIKGQRLRLVVADDEFKPDRTVAQVRRLIHEDGVIGFVAGAGAANWDAVVKAEVLQGKDVPVVGVITAASFVREPSHRNLFFLRPTIRTEVEGIFQQLTSMGIARIAVLYQDDAFGADALVGVKSASEKFKVTPLVVVGHKRDGSDVSAAMDKVMASGALGVAILNASFSASAAVKRAREVRFPGQLVAMSVVDAQAVVTAVGAEQARGLGLVQVMPNPRSQLLPLAQEFRDAVSASGKTPSGGATIALEGYVAARVMVDAIKRAGSSPTAADVYRVLTTSGLFDVGGFAVKFDATNRTGSTYTGIAVVDHRGSLLY